MSDEAPTTPTIIRYPSPFEVGAASALATMGALPLGLPPSGSDVQTQGSLTFYSLAACGGAAAGGGLVGFVAAGDFRGAATGAFLTGGLAGLAEAFALWRRQERRLGAALGIAGILAVGASIWVGARR